MLPSKQSLYIQLDWLSYAYTSWVWVHFFNGIWSTHETPCQNSDFIADNLTCRVGCN